MLASIIKAILSKLPSLLSGEAVTINLATETVNLGALGSFEVTEMVTVKKSTEVPATTPSTTP